MPPSGGLTEDNAGIVFSSPCRPDTIPGQRGRSQRTPLFFVFPTDRRWRTLAYFEPSAQNRLYGPSEGLTDARSPEADRGRVSASPYAAVTVRTPSSSMRTSLPVRIASGTTQDRPPPGPEETRTPLSVMWGPREQRGGLSHGLDTLRCEEGASSPLTVHVPLSFV